METLEYVVKNCKWKRTFYDVDICTGEANPCSAVIANARCDTIKEFLERRERIYDGKRFNSETIGV